MNPRLIWQHEHREYVATVFCETSMFWDIYKAACTCGWQPATVEKTRSVHPSAIEDGVIEATVRHLESHR